MNNYSALVPGIAGYTSCTHTQGSHIFIHLEQMENFSQLTGFIMMEISMVICLGCCYYKGPKGEIYSRNL
jgi:hypothetical protein